MRVYLYDTTLRDGAQSEGISFSVEDKLKVALKLDELGVDYIEGGWPGANPKDAAFFARARDLKLCNSSLVAFGSTRRPRTRPGKDANLAALVDAGTRAVTIVGKASSFQVTAVLETTLAENLKMVSESIQWLKDKGITVFLDAEHFFDGFKKDPEYSLRVVEAAAGAGVDCVVLCDTNGGSLPEQIATAVAAALSRKVPIGIHTHNDSELAVANSLAAVKAGARHVQGTINGYGERCGNANLCSVIPNLQLKLGIECLPKEKLAKLTEISHAISEIANLSPNTHLPYVGMSAFAHKAGLHVSGMVKHEESYQHISPELVGNRRRILVSELAGKSNVMQFAKEKMQEFTPDSAGAKRVLERVKLLESRGFQFDGADASFELLLRQAQPDYKPPFELVDFMVVVEKRRRQPTVADAELEEMLSEATVKVRIEGQVIHTAAEGNGPVNALDAALRKALLQFYPSLQAVKLIDYKVRILDESSGTDSRVRVLIECTDGEEEWRTVGSSTNIIEASWLALAASLEYWLGKKANHTK